ncbi:DegT/DnrJ/EryC1/StrS family aminotransferase [Kitasatospora griseola]|uniref:DegT/DnrJ/EryC1/StrS family aminotransferase n=1 Tax=Kitasatospora griseola TaxID=2064 RepID=UPI0038213A9A
MPLRDDEIAAAVRVLRGGHLVQGREVASLEEEFAPLVDGRHCIAVNSGTSALHLTLLALGIGPGDQVVVPSFTFAATAHAVSLTGAIPVFADIDPATYCLDPGHVDSLITPRTRAVVPVHLFGHPAAMPQLRAIADRHHLALVEDAAQAHGARLDDASVGALGHAAAFSFYPTKNMHSVEGGVIATGDAGLAHRLRLLRNHGMDATRYHHEIIGTNARMTDVSAAIGRVQLRSLAERTERRRLNAGVLDATLAGVKTPAVAPGTLHVYHQYVVRVPGARDHLRDCLADAGIGTAVHYPTPIHRMPAYNLDLDLPHAEQASREVLSLPVHPSLTDDDLASIAKAVNAA